MNNQIKCLYVVLLGLGLIATPRLKAQTYKNLYSFDGLGYALANSDGADPVADLTLSGTRLYGTASGGGDAGKGAVFAVNIDGTGFTVLHSFSKGDTPDGYILTNHDGISPQSGLLLSGNTLYGTANSGGIFGNGTVFKVNTDGTGFTTLYSFTPYSEYTTPLNINSDGGNPMGTLVLSGNALYGTAYWGGTLGNGTIFKVNTDGTGFTNLYNFTNGTDGANPEAGMILSGNTLYGTASFGGSSSNGTVFKINTDGTAFTTLHSFTGDGGDGAAPAAGLILSNNALFGTAKYGGSYYSGTIFRVNTDGTEFTNLYNFSANDVVEDGAWPQAKLILTGNTLYGTTYSGGTLGNGTIFKINTDGTGFATLCSFDGTTGGQPSAGLIASGAALYGTAAMYGPPDAPEGGVLFKIYNDGTDLTAVHPFTATEYVDLNDGGANPEAGVVLANNKMYGTASTGGVFGNGTIFTVGTDGMHFTDLYTFTTNYNLTNSDGANPQGGLAFASNTLYGAAADGGRSGNGTLFKINGDGIDFTVLHSFTATDPETGTNSDGANPKGGVILSGNTLYGTTMHGGTGSNGIVFKVNTDGTGFTALHSFTALNADTNNFIYTNGDGANPQAVLILSGNTLYGTTYSGGSSGSGTVFSISTNGTGFTVLYNFTMATAFDLFDPNYGYYTIYTNADGANPQAGLILLNNTLYGTVSSGGSSGSGTVFRMNANGTGFTVLHSFAGAAPQYSGGFTNNEGAASQAGLTLFGDTLYGTAGQGGSYGFGTLFSIKTDGTGFTNLYNFGGGIDGNNPRTGFTMSGNTLYGTTYGYGSGVGGGTVFALVLPAVQLQPPILGIDLSGSNLVISAANGESNHTYIVLMSTNLSLPVVQWTPIATNTLKATGNFTITATNAVDPRASQRFYILKMD